MNQVVQWMKEYVGLFLAFSLVLYVLPEQSYRGYIRFFLELILVLFCLRPVVHISSSGFEKRWNETYQSFLQEMKQREEEAESLSFVDEDYIKLFLEDG